VNLTKAVKRPCSYTCLFVYWYHLNLSENVSFLFLKTGRCLWIPPPCSISCLSFLIFFYTVGCAVSTFSVPVRFLPRFIIKSSRRSILNLHFNLSDFPWDFLISPGSLNPDLTTLHSLVLFVPRFLAFSSKLCCICVLLFCVCFLAVYRDLTNLNDLIIVTFKVDRRVWVLTNLLEKALSYM